MGVLHALFSSLSNRLGMDIPLKFDAEGHMRLCVDGDMHMDLKYTEDQQTLHAYVALGQVPPAAPAQLWKQMLQANLFGAGTGGATLAIDELAQEVLLVRSLDVESATVDGLALALENLIQSSLSWRNKFTQMHWGQDDTAPAVERNSELRSPWVMMNNA